MLTLSSRLDCLGISPHHRKPYTALPTDTVLPCCTGRDPLPIDQASSPGRSADLRGSRDLIGCSHPEPARVYPFPGLLRNAAFPQWWLACRGERPRSVGMRSSKNVPQIELVVRAGIDGDRQQSQQMRQSIYGTKPTYRKKSDLTSIAPQYLLDPEQPFLSTSFSFRSAGSL